MNDVIRILRVLGIAFLFFGVLVLAVAVWMGLRTVNATKGMVAAKGEIVSVDNFRPVVRFTTASGQPVTVTGGVSPEYSAGQQVQVYYDPADPQRFRIGSGRWSSTIQFGALGLLFGGLGMGALVFIARRNRRAAWLRSNGIKAVGRIVEVKEDTSVSINNRSTWKIVVDWSGNGLSGRASARMSKDPRPLLGQRTELPVWVDPKNPNNVLVDTDVLKP